MCWSVSLSITGLLALIVFGRTFVTVPSDFLSAAFMTPGENGSFLKISKQLTFDLFIVFFACCCMGLQNFPYLHIVLLMNALHLFFMLFCHPVLFLLGIFFHDL